METIARETRVIPSTVQTSNVILINLLAVPHAVSVAFPHGSVKEEAWNRALRFTGTLVARTVTDVCELLCGLSLV